MVFEPDVIGRKNVRREQRERQFRTPHCDANSCLLTIPLMPQFPFQQGSQRPHSHEDDGIMHHMHICIMIVPLFFPQSRIVLVTQLQVISGPIEYCKIKEVVLAVQKTKR